MCVVCRAHTNGIIDNTNRRGHELNTFPRQLDGTGYDTAFVGKWHMGTDGTPRPGFDTWVSLIGQGTGRPETWMGESAGSWDGDALVVESANFNDKTWIDRRGVPHSNQLRVTEQFSRNGDGQLILEITVEDPVAFTRSWMARRVFDSVNWRLEENVCMENSLFEEFSAYEHEVLEHEGGSNPQDQAIF